VKKATKRELIVVDTMISRMIKTSVFSDRIGFSVATGGKGFERPGSLPSENRQSNSPQSYLEKAKTIEPYDMKVGPRNR
jgi:hypothetical protein